MFQFYESAIIRLHVSETWKGNSAPTAIQSTVQAYGRQFALTWNSFGQLSSVSLYCRLYGCSCTIYCRLYGCSCTTYCRLYGCSCMIYCRLYGCSCMIYCRPYGCSCMIYCRLYGCSCMIYCRLYGCSCMISFLYFWNMKPDDGCFT
jgi:hypothetical protein